MARRLEGTGVTATCLHPGVVNTNLWNRNKGLLHYGLRFLKSFYLSPQKSAEAVVRLAVDPAVEGVTGVYFDRMTEHISAPLSHDKAVAARLWTVSAAMTGLDAARTSETLPG